MRTNHDQYHICNIQEQYYSLIFSWNAGELMVKEEFDFCQNVLNLMHLIRWCCLGGAKTTLTLTQDAFWSDVQTTSADACIHIGWGSSPYLQGWVQQPLARRVISGTCLWSQSFSHDSYFITILQSAFLPLKGRKVDNPVRAFFLLLLFLALFFLHHEWLKHHLH